MERRPQLGLRRQMTHRRGRRCHMRWHRRLSAVASALGGGEGRAGTGTCPYASGRLSPRRVASSNASAFGDGSGETKVNHPIPDSAASGLRSYRLELLDVRRFLLGLPEVEFQLHAEPAFRRCIRHARDTHGHLGTHGRVFVQQLREGLSRHTQPLGGFGDG